MSSEPYMKPTTGQAVSDPINRYRFVSSMMNALRGFERTGPDTWHCDLNVDGARGPCWVEVVILNHSNSFSDHERICHIRHTVYGASKIHQVSSISESYSEFHRLVLDVWDALFTARFGHRDGPTVDMLHVIDFGPRQPPRDTVWFYKSACKEWYNDAIRIMNELIGYPPGERGALSLTTDADMQGALAVAPTTSPTKGSSR